MKNFQLAINKLDSLLTLRRVVIFGVLILFAALAGIVLVILSSYDNWDRLIIYGHDFRCFYGAGKILLESEISQLYSPQMQGIIQEQLGFHMKDGWSWAPYLNPPVYAWVMQFFALIPYPGAVTLWRIIGILIVIYSLRKIIFELDLDIKWHQVLILLLASFPGFITLCNGQNTFFFLAIYILSFILLFRNKDFYAGILLGLGFFKPQLFWMVPVLFLMQKKWKSLLGAFITFVFLSLASLLLVGVEGAISYLELLGSDEYNWFVNWRLHDMHSLPAFINLSSGIELGGFSYLFVVVLFLAAFWLYMRWKNLSLDSTEIFSISILVTLIFNIHLFHYDLSLMALPYLLILVWTKGKQVDTNLKKQFRLTMTALYLFMWISSPVVQSTGLQLSVLLMAYLLFLTLQKVHVTGKLNNMPLQ